MSVASRRAPILDVSPQELLHAVTLASSQSIVELKEGEQKLKELGEQNGVLNCLHEIAAERSLPPNVRLVAAIQFKNKASGLSSQWRTRKNSPEDKARIRTRCLTFVDEPNDSIASCNEEAASKIARTDFPKEWPTVISDLVILINNNLEQRLTATFSPEQSLILRRSLSLLARILKELATMRMMQGQKNMNDIITQFGPKLEAYLNAVAPRILPPHLTERTISDPEAINEIFIYHLLFKAISRLVKWFWTRQGRAISSATDENAWIGRFFQAVSSQVISLISFRKSFMLANSGFRSDPQSSSTLDRISRVIITIGKFLLHLQKTSKPRFMQLSGSSEVILFYWRLVEDSSNFSLNDTDDSEDLLALFPTRLLVQGMHFFRSNLDQWCPLQKDGTPNPHALPEETVSNAVRFLITKFMKFSSEDLNKWQADPEEWFKNEEIDSEQIEYQIRACSDRVLMSLCQHFPQYVTPMLSASFGQIISQPAVDYSAILQKEAIYTALGRCALRLKDQINFENWLDSQLYQEAQQSDANLHLIRRRIAWVIARLVADGCLQPTNGKIWETLAHLLTDRGVESDLPVRLTAAVAIGDSVPTLDTKGEVLAPYLQIILSQIVKLLGECEQFEVKRRVSASLSAVLEEVGPEVIPHVNIVAGTIPGLWLGAGEQWAFKMSLLRTVTKLVECLKSQSSGLSGITVPLIQDSITKEALSQLDEDALKLWIASLRNAVTIQGSNGEPALQQLFSRVLELLATNMDLLGQITTVIESYMLLDSFLLLQTHGVDIFQAFLVGLSSEAVLINKKDMINVLSIIIQIAPSSLWGEAMHRSGLFGHLLQSLALGEKEALLLTHYIHLFSRIAIKDHFMFQQLMTAAVGSKTEAELYNSLLDQWWLRFDNMSEPRHRKLTAMGIAAVVSTGNPAVLTRLPTEIFNLWLDVFGEIREAVESAEENPLDPIEGALSPLNLRRHWELDEAHPSWYAGSEGTPEFDRRKQLYEMDPIRNVKLSTYISERLQEANASCGPAGLQGTYLAQADPVLLQQIQKELSS